MFATLAGMPLFLGLTRTALPAPQPDPGVASLYANGLHSMGVAGIVALPLAFLFCFWLIAGQSREVGRRYLNPGARNRRNLVENARTFSVIFGGVGIIVGSLSGLYAALIVARPELYSDLPIPVFTFSLAIPSLLIGGTLYAAGRINR
ncbi:MAG TPA: hypothetical protein VGO52_20530 [Hyphomonadaceae bacterium]|nr:hypothetical protein [Hyphomonadaceae bacterium]